MRLFIAAGIVSTIRLVLESMGAINKVVMLKDSQYFLLPLLRYSVPPSFDADEPAHTLPQAFIEIFDESVSETSVHLQVYGYNNLYHLAIKNALSPMYAVELAKGIMAVMTANRRSNGREQLESQGLTTASVTRKLISLYSSLAPNPSPDRRQVALE